MKKFIIVLLTANIFSLHLQAQDIPQSLKQEKWVKIMDNDSAANFLEADASFRKYYASYLKEKNKEENGKQNNNAPAEEEHMKSPEEFLIAGYLKWSINIKPFVLADGMIMPMARRLAIIEASRNKPPAH